MIPSLLWVLYHMTCAALRSLLPQEESALPQTGSRPVEEDKDGFVRDTNGKAGIAPRMSLLYSPNTQEVSNVIKSQLAKLMT